MLDVELQSRIAKNYSDAAVGYATAMSAAYGHAASMMFGFWADALKPAASDRSEPRSWYREPARQSATLPMMAPFSGPAAANPFQIGNPLALNPLGMSHVGMNPMVMNPFALAMGPGLAATAMLPWMSMLLQPPMGRPAAAPMAFMMLAVGIPRAIAEPAAEANAAMIEANEAVAQSVENTFSAYRSDGGHAVAQIMHHPGRAVVAAMMLPLGGQLTMFPWLSMMRGI